MKTTHQLRAEARVLRMIYLLVSSGADAGEAFGIVAAHFPDTEFAGPLQKAHDKSGNSMRPWQEGVRELESCLSSFTFDLVSFDGRPGETRELDEILWTVLNMIENQAQLRQSGASDRDCNKALYFCLLGELVASGCPILRALEVAGRHYLPDDRSKLVIESLREGETLTAGMAQSPEFFGAADLAFIDISEQIGSLPVVCRQIVGRHTQAVLQGAKQSFLSPPASPEELNVMDQYRLLAHFLESSPVSVKHRLDLVARPSEGFRLMNDMWVRLNTKVKQGLTIAAAMKSVSGFPPFAVRVMELGEDQEQVADAFCRLASYYRAEYLGCEMSYIPRAVSA